MISYKQNERQFFIDYMQNAINHNHNMNIIYKFSTKEHLRDTMHLKLKDIDTYLILIVLIFF